MSLDVNNIKSLPKKKVLSSYKNRIKQLTYNIINFSSQDPFHPINFLLLKNKNNKNGWISSRYCIYPQEILIQFPQMVNIRQINILIHENKIPKMIELINCIPVGEKEKFIIDNNNNSKIIPSEFVYQNIGFINLSSNIESQYKARELRKIYININTEYIKLKIHNNYQNDLNVFCQVGIVSLDFFGIKNDIKKKKSLPEGENNNMNDTSESLFDICFNNNEIEEKFIDDKMSKQSSDKLKQLIEELNKKKEKEEYDECKLIKDKIDKIRKIEFKIYTLEEQKKDCANRNDFDKAKEIKFNIEKIKKLLEFYLLDNNYNQIKIKKEESKNNNRNNNIEQNGFVFQSHDVLNNENLLEYDEIILPSVMKRMKKNNSSFDKSRNNSGENSYESLDHMKIDEPIVKEPLEDLDNNLRNKYELLICFVGEDAIRKIFSKFIYYKEEGFNILKIKVKDIIFEQKNTSEANKYIVLLMDIVFIFLDDRHPSIVSNSLDVFSNILKAIEEKSKENNISYDFTITKKILNKIKEKLNDISKKVRTKAADLYCLMLNTDFCEYNTLLIELIENEVINQFNKYLLNLTMKNKYKYKFSFSDNFNYNNKNEIKSSKQLIITKMSIFLKVLNNFDEAVKKNKTDKQKFPKNILGDFIIMNINHPKDDVRDITKDVMIKFIGIFGNKILNKLNLIMDDKELNKIIQDKEELKDAYNNFKNEKLKVKDDKMNVSHSTEGLFLTNVNKKFQSKNNTKNKLMPIRKYLNNGIKINNDKKMLRSSSQPKFGILKSKLKPIIIKGNNKILVNSKSQRTLEKEKK